MQPARKIAKVEIVRPTTIRGWMTPSPTSVGRDQPIAAALRLMRLHEIRHLPVLEEGKLVGIVSERDMYFIQSIAGVDITRTTVDAAMTQNVYCVAPETPLREVVAEMASHRYGCAVVIEGKKAIGIFTVVDALDLLAETLSGPE